MIMTVIGSIVGLVLVAVGSVWLFFNLRLRPLHVAEVELMKMGGVLEGDPDWMHEFNVAQSEFDLEANERNRYLAITIIVVGFLILSGLVVRTWLT